MTAAAAAFEKPNNQMTKHHISGHLVCKLCSLQPPTIDWPDKCTFPDISLQLCVQMIMLVSQRIGSHLLPCHALGEQCEGVVLLQGKNGSTQTDKQTHNQ